jgi:hypothetical protein
MSCSLEYHISVRHSIPVTVGFLSLLLLTTFFVSTGHAQINGTPASVTSSGFGGRAVNGTPASVTSLGPRGFAPGSRVNFSAPHAFRNGEIHHRHHYVQYAPPVVYAVPVPYAVDIGATDDEADPGQDESYQGGPTIFDRRGSGAASYVPPVRDVPPPHATQDGELPNQASNPDPGPPQVPTMLVFKDGRNLEVGNYAIIGQTLFDLTPGHTRKVALADLDLEATRQQNEERGITFQLPPSSQAN